MKEVILVFGKSGKGKLISQLKTANKNWLVAEYKEEKNSSLLSSIIDVIGEDIDPLEFIEALLKDGAWQTFNPEADGFIFYSNDIFSVESIGHLKEVIANNSPFDMNIIMLQ